MSVNLLADAGCGAQNLPLQIEHLVPRSRGGSNRVSNLTLACQACNLKKGNRTAEEYGYPHLQAQAKQPLKDAAAVNTIRWALYKRLRGLGLPVETGSGGLTKYNRSQRGLAKNHWLDAACVGQSTPEQLKLKGVKPMLISASGHGNRQMCRTDKYGFPNRHRQRRKSYFGFRTGDMVRAVVTAGKKAGGYVGRVSVRASGNFDLVRAGQVRVQGISYRYCQPIQRNDGYAYNWII